MDYYSEEAEQSVIGCLLAYNSEAAELLTKISASDFYFENHQQIFQSIQGMLNDGAIVDVLTVHNGMNRSVDIAYLMQLAESHTGVSSALHYCDIVKGHSDKRALSLMAFSMLEQLRESDADSVRDFALARMTDIQTGSTQKQYSIAEGAKALVKAMKDRHQSGNMMGIPTGFKNMDFAWDGLHRQALYTLGGTPGTGKTSLIMNMIEHQAKPEIVELYGKPIIFSQEMGEKALATRLVSKRSKIGMSKLRKADLRDDEWTTLMSSVQDLIVLSDNMIIDCSPSITPAYAKTKLHEVELKYGKVGAVYFDYFTLMQMEKNVSKDQATSDNANALDALKKLFNCPVIVLTQLNKDVLKHKKKPNEGDVDWGKQLIQNADAALFLHATDDMREKGFVELYSAKVRDMEPIEQLMKFDGSTSTFREAMQDDYQPPEENTGSGQY
jgi:replicative DNA helicase